MSITRQERSVLTAGAQALLLSFALWLVWPVIRLDSSAYAHAGQNAVRMFVGLLIMLIMLGKLSFDVMLPQGLARRVSNVKTAALMLFGILLLALIVFTVARAGAMFVNAAASQDAASQAQQ